MIISMQPVSLADVKEIIKDMDEKKQIEDYLKKFGNLKKDKSDALADEIKKLDNLKIKEEHVVKVIDFMPSNSEEVNKIFSDVSMSEEEVNAILEIVKKY